MEVIKEKLNKLYEPSYIYRDYKQDFSPPDTSHDELTPTRIFAAVLPFFTLNRQFGFAASVVGSTARLVKSGQEFKAMIDQNETKKNIALSFSNTAVSFGTLALMFTAPVVGMAITTAHDTAFHLGHLYSTIGQESQKKTVETVAHIFLNAIYLSLFFTASLELTVCSLTAQILFGFYQSAEEFKKGDQEGYYLEGTSQLMMAAFRIHQMQPVVQQMQFNWKLAEAKKQLSTELTQILPEKTDPFEIELRKILADLPEKYFVGELGENWEFPSDHLPVGATINGKHIGSWNVLDSNFLDWIIEKNSQGINGGLISKFNRASSVMKGFTVREVLILHQILTMVDRSDRPFDILALQECNAQFIKGLQCLLPKHIGLIQEIPGLKDQEIVLYNRNIFAFLPQESQAAVSSAFPSAKPKLLMDLIFKDRLSGEKFQIICAHVPGDPALPGRYEFANYVVSHKKMDAVTVALGDMNFNPIEMSEAFEQAAKQLHVPHLFSNDIAYYTNIDPSSKGAKNIDQIWAAPVKGKKLMYIADLPDEVLPGLQWTVNQLLPHSERLEELYKGKKIDYIRFMSECWRRYLDRLKAWEKISQLAAT